jgi:hypothetical protein
LPDSSVPQEKKQVCIVGFVPATVPDHFLRNGKEGNEIILAEFCAANASRVFLRWYENCHPPIINMLREGEIGQVFSER